MAGEVEALVAEFAQRLTEAMKAEKKVETKAQVRLLTAKEAGEYIGRSEQAVRHLIFQRDIPTVRNGRCVRIDRKDLDTWVENHKC